MIEDIFKGPVVASPINSTVQVELVDGKRVDGILTDVDGYKIWLRFEWSDGTPRTDVFHTSGRRVDDDPAKPRVFTDRFGNTAAVP